MKTKISRQDAKAAKAAKATESGCSTRDPRPTIHAPRAASAMAETGAEGQP